MGDGALVGAQVDDQLRLRQAFPEERIETPAEIELRTREQSPLMEEARKAVEVEIEPAVGQANLGRVAQPLFLLGAQQQIIDLVCQRITRILFEESLKGTLGMFFIGRLE